MARARKKKAKPARKRAAKRTTKRKAVVEQSQTNWTIGAGVLALALMLGAAIYAVTLNDGTRTSVANFVESIEVPQAVKEFPHKVKQNLPEMPALTNSSTPETTGGGTETAPAQN